MLRSSDQSPSFSFHSRMVVSPSLFSQDTDTMEWLSAAKATSNTQLRWPEKTCMSLPLSTCHRRKVQSFEADTIADPSLLNDSAVTSALWPSYLVTHGQGEEEEDLREEVVEEEEREEVEEEVEEEVTSLRVQRNSV